MSFQNRLHGKTAKGLRAGAATAALCLALALAACGGRATHYYVDTKDVKVDSISHKADGDFLVVSAVLKNKGSSVQHSVYRMQWFDASGALIEQSAWRPVIIKGNVPAYVKERSSVPGAKEYTLIISNDAS